MRSAGSSRAPTIAALAVWWAAACETARPVAPDGGTDAPIDAPDAPPPDPCPAIGPVVEVEESSCPELDLGVRGCIAQDGCALELVVADGTTSTGVVAEREVELPFMGIDCVWTLDDLGGAALDCDDSLGIGCTARVRGIAVAGAPACCWPGDDRCEAPAACTLVLPAIAGPIAATACVERTGAVLEGAACTRTEPGHDDCAAGLFCTALGAATGEVCGRLCRAASDCGTGGLCAGSGVVPPVGVCARSCDPFADTCGGGLVCTIGFELGAGASPICDAPGTAGPGELCDALGCVGGHECVSDGAAVLARCRPFCDAAHPCSGAETCEPLTGALGTCAPAP